MPDISNLLPSMGVQLEAQAFKTLGAAVSSGVSGALAGVLNSANSVAASAFGSELETFGPSGPGGAAGTWEITPYASAIASGRGQLDPKTKFLFKVTFAFNPSIISQAQSYGIDLNSMSRNLTFVVKQIDLPKYQLEYEEVNMYNFRTKILRQVKHDELNIMFYDDVANNAMNLVNTFLQVLVPLSRSAQSPTSSFGDHGFDFSNTLYSQDSSMRAALSNGSSQPIEIFSTITITQYYLARNLPGSIINSIKANNFIFTNPRFTRMEVSDMDHEQGAIANTIVASFDFDALHIDTGRVGTTVQVPTLPAGDLLSGVPSGMSVTSDFSSAGGGGNPFSAALNVGSLTTPPNLSSVLQTALSSGSAGGAQGAIAGALTPYGTAAAKTLASVGTGIAPGISLPKLPILSDSNTSSSSVPDLSTQTSSNSGYYDD